MKIVKILGGLGNQMFQYSMLIALRETFHQEVLMDTSLFKTYPLHNGFELNKIYNIRSRSATNSEINKVYHNCHGSYLIYRMYRHLYPPKKSEIRDFEDRRFNPSLLMNSNYQYYDGYWQDYRYFNEFKNVIKDEFSYKTKLDSKNMDYYSLFLNSNTVSIHVRRGDYLKDKEFGNICDLDYYSKAIEYVNSVCNNVTYAVFSNDYEWCHENIMKLFKHNKCINVNWNIGNESYKDMQLMNACRINIIANSSFSWWGAYLNLHKNNMVISPLNWTRNGQQAKRQLPEWILI